MRLRKKGKTTSLTFKVGRSAHREEREIKLSPKQFAALWPATVGRRLYKLRYEMPWKNFLIEIDIYRRKHKGLVVAEVEFLNRTACGLLLEVARAVGGWAEENFPRRD